MSPPARLDVLTALRGLAAWWVVGFHFRDSLEIGGHSLLTDFLSPGYLAVDFFFILSGLVIFLGYHRIFEENGLKASSIFFVRRLARIYPLYILILFAYLANPVALRYFSASGVIGPRYEENYFLASIFMVQNWGFFDRLEWNIPAWSISTEWAAYLLFPFLLALVGRFCSGVLGHLVPTIGCALVLALLFFGLGSASIGDDIGRLGLPRCLLEFSMGVIGGHLLFKHRLFVDAHSLWFGSVAAVTLIGGWHFMMPDYVYVPVAFFLAILAFASSTMQKMPVLSSAALVYLGEISYSTYLVHYLIKDWVTFLSPAMRPALFIYFLAVTLVASMLLYRFVEKPCRTWGKRWAAGKYADGALGN